MARLIPATRDSVPEQQSSIFDEIIGSGSPPANGPGSITIHVPEAAKRASALNQYLREGSSLPKKIQELAMLVTAHAGIDRYLESLLCSMAADGGGRTPALVPTRA